MPPPEESIVVSRLEPFEEFYRREYRRLVALAYALSGSRVAAEDLAQEACLVAHKQWERIGQLEQPAAWVRKVLSNMAISNYRRRLAEAKALARLAGRRQDFEVAPEDENFWKQVRRLPGKQAQAIALYYLEDRPVTEIATILDCSPNTAKVHLFKGRQKLAEMLGVQV